MIELALLAAAAHFAPPLDVPLSCVTTETRTIGDTRFAFTTTRHLTFERAGDGYLALLTIDAVEGDDGNPVGAMVRAALKGFAGRTIRYRLDAAGSLVAIEDRARIWAGLQQAVEQLGKTPEQRQRAARFAATLSGLSAAQQRAMIGSMLEVALAGHDAALEPGSSTPIDIAADAASGRPARLHGTRTVVETPDHHLALHDTASGAIPGNADAARVTLTRETVINPVTGLVAHRHEITATTIGSRHSTIERTTEVTAPVS